MNIEKAIEIKEEMHSLGLAPYDEDSLEADRLSIEALKEVERLRLDTFLHIGALLPGETED